MSGPEIIVAVLPLMISAAEHYKTVFEPFSRYRNFNTGVQRFRDSLKIQHARFRNTCKLLLEHVTHRELAIDILDCKAKAEPRLNEELVLFLGDSIESCFCIVAQVSEVLEKIRCLKFLDIEGESKPIPTDTNSSILTSCQRKALKIKYSVSKQKLEKYLQQLKGSNDDFESLLQQIQALSKLECTPTQSRRKPLKRDIRQFLIIQGAAQHLFGLMSRACTLHTEHIAHCSLEVEHISPENTDDPSQLRFSLALAHNIPSGHLSADHWLWMTIELTALNNSADDRVTASVKHQRAVETLADAIQTSHKRPAEPCQEPRKVKKSVRFSMSGSVAMLNQSIPAQIHCASALSKQITNKDVSSPKQLYICKEGNLCTTVRANLKRHGKAKCGAQNNSQTCIGILDETEKYRQVVYPREGSATSSEPVALSDFLIARHQTSAATSLSQYEVIKLATKLSKAVLRYHATSWMRSSWRSSDIYFFDSLLSSDAEDDIGRLTTPHFMTKVVPSCPSSSKLSDQRLGALCQPYAHNQPLFGLGVVLLELAIRETLGSIHVHDEMSAMSTVVLDPETEFKEAKRLSTKAGARMGSTYGRIVEKCLWCDFGCGSNLNDRGLQERVYQDVICPLVDLEEKLKALEL